MFRVGQQFGVYTLTQQLGRGAFGEVWLAERRTKFVTTRVAVKLPRDAQVDHAAIKQEAQLWARASGHANVLPIIEANEYDGQILIVSEYAEDGSLEGLLERSGGALPVKQAVEMMIGILKGLEFLHSRQIIHRDIKPANILLQGSTPRLADFGISRILRTTSQTTNVAGTPCYMAPEAFQRKRTAQTDIWSVGVMLYQMLKGELPFSGDNMTDLFGAIMLSQPTPLPDSILLELKKIVGKALSKDVAGRYHSAYEMREELEECWLRLFPPVARTQEPSVVNEADDQEAIIIPISSPSINEQRSEIEKPNGVPNNHSVSPPSSLQVKAETNRVYLALPVIVFVLLAIITAGYWLRHRISGNMAATSNTNTSTVTSSSPNMTVDTLLIPFRKGNKWGFSDGNKKLVVEAKYDYASPFFEGLASVELNHKWGYVDQTGQEVIPLKYNYASAFSEGLASVRRDGKYGYIDKTGKEVILFKYDDAYSFNEGLASVRRDGKCGFIDTTGNEVIPLKYDQNWGFSFSEGLASVRRDGKSGFVDKTGKEVIPLSYDYAHPFSEELAFVKRGGKSGFIDKMGQEVIPLNYDDASMFSEGLASVRRDGKCGFIDKTGKEIIPLKYDYAYSSSEGMVSVGRDGKYYYASMFSEGLARVQRDGKYGYVDKMGQEVIPPKLKYDDAFMFSEGLASVRRDGKYGYIDKMGQEVIPLKYDDASMFRAGLAFVKRDGKTFLIDRNGTEYYAP